MMVSIVPPAQQQENRKGGNSARYDELINLPNNYNIGSDEKYENVESINNDDSMIKTINIVEPGAASRIAAYSLL